MLTLSRFAKSFLATIFALFVLTTIALLHPPSRAYIDPWTGELFGEGGVEHIFYANHNINVTAGPVASKQLALKSSPSSDITNGGVIMSKLGNATAKAELGRAAWKLMHTMTLRYPKKPTIDERDALNAYFYLTSRLYPCGECAAEFQLLLKKYPPQTSSRKAAASWLCFVHNQVNSRLGKPDFDCAHLEDKYDCGCGDDGESEDDTKRKSGSSPVKLDPGKYLETDKVTGAGLIKGG